MNLISI